MPTGTKRTAGIAFAVLLAGVIVLVAATSGIGKPSLPEDDLVAFVDQAPDGEVTQEQFDAALEQAAARQQVQEVPPPGTPQYDALKETAMGDLLLSRWVRGEADELGVEVTDREIDQELETIIQDQFGGQKQFDRFLEQSKFSEEDARERVALQIMQQRITEDVVGTEPPDIPDEEVENFYNENIEQFQTPETRDVRTILTQDEAEADQAFDQLSQDDSPASWKQVAQEFSTDEATAELGGLRQGVAQGQNEPQLDEAIFSAPEGELVGPLSTDAGFYVIQVEQITEASTQPLDEQTRGQIVQTLASEQQQETAAAFQTDFLEKWQALTVCNEDYAIDRCSNAPPPPDPCAGDDDGEEPTPDPTTGEPTEGCPAWVPSTRPVPPSQAGDSAATGLPQGPQGLAPPAPALPPGTQTIPGAPPGTVPPGTAPPGTAPPGTPQGGPPPTAP
jgi:parvulin-like peptidyl-prolyl isomerase